MPLHTLHFSNEMVYWYIALFLSSLPPHSDSNSSTLAIVGVLLQLCIVAVKEELRSMIRSEYHPWFINIGIVATVSLPYI